MLDPLILIPTQDERIDKFLATALPDWTRSKIQAQIDLGNVLVSGQIVKPSFKVQPGIAVEIKLVREYRSIDLEPAEIDFSVQFEDEYLLVVDKPRGLATHPALSLKEPSLVNALLHYSNQLSYQNESFRPGIVHRLDKQTSGLLIIAKNEDIHSKLAYEIQEKNVQRRYLAIVDKVPTQENFTVEGKIGRHPRNRLKMHLGDKGKDSRTHFKTLAKFDDKVLLGAKLETGRTHQIRVHLQFVNSPILGDDLYGHSSFEGAMQLHAAYINFIHPVSQKEISIQSTPPQDFLYHDIPWEKLIQW